MKENKIKEAINEIQLSDTKREELWNETIKKASHRPHLSKRMIAAAAMFLLLLLPVGVYAATGFEWSWDETEEKNQALNPLFQKESGCVEANGFRFRIEQAMVDKNMGIGYYYISVTDTTGAGRNPRNFCSGYEEDVHVGDILYSISIQGDSSGEESFDEKNSTGETAYFYIEEESWENEQGGNKINIEFSQIKEIKRSNDDNSNKLIGSALDPKTIQVKNIVRMPTLTWKIKKNPAAEIRLSPVIARIDGIASPDFEIDFKNGDTLRDYFDFNQGAVSENGTLPKNSFTSKTKSSTDTNTIYRYNYINPDDVAGIRIDGIFYPVEDAKEKH